MSPTVLTELEDRFVLRLADLEVTRCSVDYALTLVLGSGDDALYVTVEQPFWFRQANSGNEVRLVPETEPEALGAVMSVLHSPVDEILAFKDGSLEIRLAGSAELRVPPHADFEAWNVVGPNHLRLVALPRGELAVWTSDEP